MQLVLCILGTAMLNPAINHLQYLVILLQDQCILELISARNYVVYRLFEGEHRIKFVLLGFIGFGSESLMEEFKSFFNQTTK